MSAHPNNQNRKGGIVLLEDPEMLHHSYDNAPPRASEHAPPSHQHGAGYGHSYAPSGHASSAYHQGEYGQSGFQHGDYANHASYQQQQTPGYDYHGYQNSGYDHSGVYDINEYDQSGYTQRPTTVTLGSDPSTYNLDQSYPSRYYRQHKTPTVVSKPVTLSSLETGQSSNGAFRPGGAVDLFSRQYIGYIVNWWLIGFFNGAIPALVFPLFGVYLHLASYQSNAVLALMDFAWNFKFFFSFLSDCLPMNRQRRKPYMYIGWIIQILMLIGLLARKETEPYMRHGEIVNAHAVSAGPKYVTPLMVLSFARILVVVASEGMMVEFAHREAEAQRGRTQIITMMVRSFGQAIGMVVVAVCWNSSEFGGSFAFSLPLPGMFGVWIFMSVVGLVATWFIVEEKMPMSSQPFKSHLQRIWRVIQQRSSWQIMVFGFFQNAGMSVEYNDRDGFHRLRLGKDTIGLNMSQATKVAGAILGGYLLKRFWLNTSWRKILICSLIFSTIINIPIETLTIFDYLPSTGIYGAAEFITGGPIAMMVLMRELVIIEITDPGYEAATYGFITNVHYLGKPMVLMLSNIFAHRREDLADDTSEIRWGIATEMWVKMGVQVIVILAIIPLLPRQKRHALERKLLGNPNLVIPVVVFFLVVVMFVTAVTANLLAVIESTSCLRFAGGNGC
ncbi:hypothetical protein Poli38472_008083 [Pythium oligandrum]|uniref:Transmembrane protein n=1 Tax=Pythium oligandrum TaxID=41045 RepID=A0A8K1CMM7_PYTOL|nr:hypothetical protein Poli38472_008083 [Pythium oligandrum]|eukprot:TMW65441.1 hypothetical protein Poli38472_008083 [Pythium oligandrum]